MARKKIKLSITTGQPGLFDMLPDEPIPEQTAKDIHDFVVKASARGGSLYHESASDSGISPMDKNRLSHHDKLRFISFGSGSSGNCAYIGDDKTGILIDAGVDSKHVLESLKANGLSMHNIQGILLTHDHSDHVRYVYNLIRKYTHVGVYCTPKTLSGLLRRHSISRRIKDYHHPIYKEFPFKIGGFEITAFDVSHDGTDNCGYFLCHGKHKFAVATDLGLITPRVDFYMRQANYIMIESNYDQYMLEHGPYPLYLRARIAADRGHLDNKVTAGFLKEIFTPKLKYIFLCHLSHDNNTPEIALKEVSTALQEAGVTRIGNGSDPRIADQEGIELIALPRFDTSPIYTFRLPQITQ